jgi:hypothetical protein
MSISNYAELKILDHATGRAAWTIPTAAYLKLHTATDPGEDGTTSPATNATRQLVTFSAAASGSIASSATVTWTNVSTTEIYRGWSLWDASTGGNCLWTGALSSDASVTAGDTFQITSLTLSLD